MIWRFLQISLRCCRFCLRCYFPVITFFRLGKAGWYCVKKIIILFMQIVLCIEGWYPVGSVASQPRSQGLPASQYGGGRREDPGTQRTKTIAYWCIPWCVHTCALIGLLFPKQRWWPFEGFLASQKCFLQCLRPKRWTELRSHCLEDWLYRCKVKIRR